MTTFERIDDLGTSGQVEGHVDPGYEAVRDAFVANFTSLGDIGAAVCVYRHGVKVVDLVGGWAKPREQAPYRPDTLQLVFSTTKGLTAACALMLVERGELDLQAPVREYWPEFATAGKEEVPVLWLLTHQAGIPTIDGQIALEEALAWEPIVEALAAQRPFWTPGTAHGYHALTYGWLVGEVVKRVSGRSLGRFFADEVATPLGLDSYIGLPEALEDRVAPLRMAPMGAADPDDPVAAGMLAAILAPDALLLRALTLNGAYGLFEEGGGPFNTRAVHAAEMPAANAITDATSLARFYAAVIGEIDGTRLLDPATVEAASRMQVEGPDKVLIAPTRFGTGFMLHSEFSPLLGDRSFGHSGAGGSLGFADPDSGIAFGYVMNQMRLGLAADERSLTLIRALRSCL